MSEPGHRGPAGPAGLAGPLPALRPLALARGTVDRMSQYRTDPAWLDDRWADPRTLVLVIENGRTLVRFGESAAELVLVPVAQAPDGLRCILGVDDGGRAYFSVAGPVPAPPGSGPDGNRDTAATPDTAAARDTADGREPGGPQPADGRDAAAGLGPGGRAPGGRIVLADLRQAGALLGDRDAGLFTQAVALANWHATHTHCPRCGALTDPVNGGYSRICRADGSEHFPRTDPAVIMLVTDTDDRALLARNSSWPQRRVSILAGFVEPGESAEQAVTREVAEETGIATGEIRYLGSQPWPMPQSLMLGFWARASAGQPIRVDQEEIAEAYWFSRDELRAAMASGEIRLPPPVSIAYRIIEAWYGDELPAQW